jgi:hypothetical protein
VRPGACGRAQEAKSNATREGIQFSEAITGDRAAIFRHALRFGPRRHRLEAHGLALRQRPDAGMAEDEESGFRAELEPRTPRICRVRCLERAFYTTKRVGGGVRDPCAVRVV